MNSGFFLEVSGKIGCFGSSPFWIYVQMGYFGRCMENWQNLFQNLIRTTNLIHWNQKSIETKIDLFSSPKFQTLNMKQNLWNLLIPRIAFENCLSLDPGPLMIPLQPFITSPDWQGHLEILMSQQAKQLKTTGKLLVEEILAPVYKYSLSHYFTRFYTSQVVSRIFSIKNIYNNQDLCST